MLGTCEQLAAGLGAASVKKRKGADSEKVKEQVKEKGEGDKVGNAPLRLWVGERYLGVFIFGTVMQYSLADTFRSPSELYKRLGKENRARKQTVANRELANIVERVAKRGLRS